MRILAYILFGGGIMAAISGAAKLPAAFPEGVKPAFLDRFPDTLPEFSIAFIATVVGLVIWWQDVFAQRKANQDNDSDESNPLKSTVNVFAPSVIAYVSAAVCASEIVPANTASVNPSRSLVVV